MSTFDIPTVLSPTQKTILSAWWKKVTVANRKGNEMDFIETNSGKVFFFSLYVQKKNCIFVK